jgi:hypothetical protein
VWYKYIIIKKDGIQQRKEAFDNSKRVENEKRVIICEIRVTGCPNK